MPQSRLDNYLRTFRRKTGLSQREVGFLLGWRDETQVCRLEKRQRAPNLRTALGYTTLFGTPVTELFAGIYDRVSSQISKRRLQLVRRLNATQVPANQVRLHAQKLKWLAKVEANPTKKE